MSRVNNQPQDLTPYFPKAGGTITGPTTFNGASNVTFNSYVSLNRGAPGLTSTNGIGLETLTPATSVIPVQMSPRFNWGGRAWDTGSLSSKLVTFKVETLPVSGNPVSGKLVWGSDINNVGYTELISLQSDGVFLPTQRPTASQPAYVKGGIYFDTTLNKLMVGGATGWETVTSV